MLLAVAAIVAYGLWAIAGITRHDVAGDPSYYVYRQVVFVAIGARRARRRDLRRPGRLPPLPEAALRGHAGCSSSSSSWPATVARGSKRWIDLGFFRFQPSEFGKLLVVLALAGFLADRDRRIGESRTVLAAIGLALPPILLVFIQPDIGSALVYVAALGAVLFVAGHALVAPRRRLRRSPALGDRLGALAAAGRGRRRAQAVPEEPPDRLPPPRPGPARLDLQRQPVDHRGRLRRRRAAAASPARRRRTSTSCPSTRPTSRSRRSPSSAASSAPASC